MYVSDQQLKTIVDKAIKEAIAERVLPGATDPPTHYDDITGATEAASDETEPADAESLIVGATATAPEPQIDIEDLLGPSAA